MTRQGLATGLLDYFDLSPDLWSEPVPTFSEQGTLTVAAADTLGLAPGTPVTYRAGDQPGFDAILLAIGTAIVVELAAGRLTYGSWSHPASAYTSGISVGILVRAPLLWPFALCSAVSILSKYVLRVKGCHLWNPSNFGLCVLFFPRRPA